MLPLLIIVAAVLALGGYLVQRGLRRRKRRAELLAGSLPPRRRERLAELVPVIDRMPPEVQDRHEGKVRLFLDQVDFQGCNGLEVTEDMRLSIAGQACLLVAGTDRWFEDLTTVMIYPGAFRSMRPRRDGYVVTEERTTRLGESWQHGPVILSWPDSEDGGLDPEDGHNLVLHEFAHQLDSMTGAADGIPLLARGQSFADWERIVLAAYDDHVARVAAGQPTVIDAYGATNHQEFFAVSVEHFFERPTELRAGYPELYDQLRLLLALDPARWPRG